MYFQPLTHFYRDNNALILKSPTKIAIYKFKTSDHAMAQLEYFPQYIPTKIPSVRIVIYGLILLAIYMFTASLFGLGYKTPKNFFLGSTQQYLSIIAIIFIFIILKFYVYYSQIITFNKLKTQIREKLSYNIENEIKIGKSKDYFSTKYKFSQNPFLHITIILNILIFVLMTQFTYDLFSQLLILAVLITDILIAIYVRADFGLIENEVSFISAAKKYNSEATRNVKLIKKRSE
jgi:uncharacterized membrane protein